MYLPERIRWDKQAGGGDYGNTISEPAAGGDTLKQVRPLESNAPGALSASVRFPGIRFTL